MTPSAYTQDLIRQRDRAEADRRAAETELGQRRQQVDRLTEQLAAARTALAALHQGEEPYDDERLVPTPAQWIWQWNRATPAARLSRAEQVIASYERLRRAHEMLLFYGESPNLRAAIHAALNDQPVPAFTTVTQTGRPEPTECDHEARAKQAEARIAAARAIAAQAAADGPVWDGNEQALGEDILTALDGTTPAPAESTLTARYLTPAVPCPHGCGLTYHSGFDCEDTAQHAAALASILGRAAADVLRQLNQRAPQLGAAFTRD